MKIWDDLVTAALLGQAQARPPALPAPVAALLPESESPRLLAAAGALTLWRRAGWRAPEIGVGPEPAADETTAPLGPASRAHLRTLQTAEFSPLLPEWLQAVAAAGRRLPAAVLPELFSWAARDADRNARVLAAGGERARWLLRQNPAWHEGAVVTAEAGSEEAWELGSLPQRLDLLSRERASAPEAARARLVAAWAKEPAAARTELLGALATGLGPADEPFLESVLDDRSKEARRVAIDLLSRLPDSAFVARQIARAEGLLRWSGNALEVTLPAPPDAAGKRDGIDLKLPGAALAVGERAAQLLLILASVPPAHWTRRFGSPPAEILAAAAANEFAVALITGFTWATVRARDRDWAATLLRCGKESLAFLTESSQLPGLLPTAAREEYLLAELRRGWSWEAHSRLLLGSAEPWSRAVSIATMAALNRALDAAGPMQPYLLRQIAPLLLRVPPECIAAAAAEFDPTRESTQALAQWLLFRLETLTALNPEPTSRGT